MGAEVGIHVEQILTMDEMDLAWQEGLQLGIALACQKLCAQDGGIDAAYHILQKGDGAVTFFDDSLPVPLIDIERVEVVHLLVGADSVHVGVDAAARLYVVFCQCESFPLCQRVHDLSLRFAHVLDRKSHRTLHTVEVIVDTQPLQDKERSGDTAQA